MFGIRKNNLAAAIAASCLVNRTKQGKQWLVISSLALAGVAQAATETHNITVTASSEQQAALSPLAGFVASRATSASKTDTSVLDTPQSISVITRDQMLLQGAQSVRQALGYTAGTRSDTWGDDNRTDGAMIRGVSAIQYLDGLLNDVASYSSIRFDPWGLERIEVLHGPAGMLYGQGAIGGIVNMISKRPQPAPAREIGVNFGNHQRKQIQADFTGPLDQQNQWLYRLVALARDSKTAVDHTKDNRYFIAPSLAWRPNENTLFTLLANFQKDDTNSMTGFFPWRGTLTANPGGQIPQNFFASEPDFDKYTAEQQAFGYQLQHKFSSNFTIRQNLRYANSHVDYRSIYIGTAGGWVAGNDRLLRRTLYMSQSKLKLFTADTQGQLDFASGSLWHKLLTGIDYQRSIYDRTLGKNGTAAPIEIFHPVYGNYTAPVLVAEPAIRGRQIGLYAQDQIEWNNWLLMLGLRYDNSRESKDNTPSASRRDSELTKRFGLIYRFDAGINPYISYTESFQGLTGFNKSAQPFKPLRGKQWEAGVKYQPTEKNMLFTASVFEMTENNRKIDGIVNGIPDKVQAGQARTRGVEIEARASLDSLDLIGSYTYLDAKVTSGNPGEQGNQLSGVPENTSSLWANYRFNLSGQPGFLAGVGIRYKGSRYDGRGNNRVGGITLYDAVLAYQHGPLRVSLNATNLFDKQYISTCLARGDCFFGTRRALIASINWRF